MPIAPHADARSLRQATWLAVGLLLTGSAAGAEPEDRFAAAIKGLVRREGLFVTYLDARAGRVLLELPAPKGPGGGCGSALYLEGIQTGLGSNPVGLDRGQLGETRVVDLRRVGGRVLLEERNLRYRARSADPAEVRAVRQSFASSVLWAGEVLAEAGDGRQLVDLTSLLVRDAHGVAARLKATGQGTFALDPGRSALDPTAARSFPDNLEFEAVLTFSSAEPGPEVLATAPHPSAVTLVQHHSLVRLPDDGYRPREWDPRAGSFEVLFADYARPVADELNVRWLVRHRLEKLEPGAARSRVKKPIVYYVDPGAPEPIRGAILEGAGWWARAFEAAGFIDAFQVKVLPTEADPLDVRYSVIQWVHRATRGWSYGGGVIDPRTGELLKGHVTLGSLRIRQDRLLFEGLAGASRTGSGAPDDPVQLSLARLRQLAAHEVGHTLGFSHNFAASTFGDRASVMDYPAPLITVDADGGLDFSRAYGTGLGAWDLQLVRHAYTQFAPGADEAAGLAAILAEGRERGYRFLSDADARPPGAAHPLAAMWDNGSDPVAELGRVLQVRRVALRRFGLANLATGAPRSTLGEVLAPLYLHHRYAVEAAAKSLGGLDYVHAVAGDGAPPASPVPGPRQRAALQAVLATLEPGELDLPEALLGQLTPPDLEAPPHRESLGSRTAPAFDALGAAATAADLTVSTLLPPERLARLVDFHRRDPGLPGVAEVLEALVQRAFQGPGPSAPRLKELRRSVQAVVVHRLLAAAADPGQTPAVRAELVASLRRLRGLLAAAPGAREPADAALWALLASDISRALEAPAPAAAPPPGPPAPVPGPPIGSAEADEACGWSTGPGGRSGPP